MPTYELETRHCKCGCGGSWRSLPTSQNEYFSIRHEPTFCYTHDDAPKRERPSPKERAERRKYAESIADLGGYPFELDPSI